MSALSPVAQDALQAAEDAERLRITQLRKATDAEFETAKQTCYQKFAVNPCIAKAREKQRSDVTDLKRQEVALNDADRKRRGAKQLQSTEAKSAPEVQTQLNEPRANALATTAQREKNLADQAAVQTSAAQTAQARRQSLQNKQADAAKAATQRRATTSTKAAQSKALYDARMKEAEEKRAKVLERKPAKPPAAGLPVPPSAP